MQYLGKNIPFLVSVLLDDVPSCYAIGSNGSCIYALKNSVSNDSGAKSFVVGGSKSHQSH